MPAPIQRSSPFSCGAPTHTNTACSGFARLPGDPHALPVLDETDVAGNVGQAGGELSVFRVGERVVTDLVLVLDVRRVLADQAPDVERSGRRPFQPGHLADERLVDVEPIARGLGRCRHGTVCRPRRRIGTAGEQRNGGERRPQRSSHANLLVHRPYASRDPDRDRCSPVPPRLYCPGPGGRAESPSSSGLGRRPFKAEARVRTPLGALHDRRLGAEDNRTCVCGGVRSPHRPVKAEIAGSKPVRRAGPRGPLCQHPHMFEPTPGTWAGALRSGRDH